MPSRENFEQALIISSPLPEAECWGVQFVPNHQAALELLAKNKIPVVVFGKDPKDPGLKNFIDQLDRVSPNTVRVLCAEEIPLERALELVNQKKVFRILQNLKNEGLEEVLKKALEKFDYHRQHRELLKVVQEQNENLEILNNDLESRVNKRLKSLKTSEDKLRSSKAQITALHSCLLAVHQARSVGEMESLLNRILTQTLDLSWVKIVFRSLSNLSVQSQLAENTATYQVPIRLGQQVPGDIYFAKTKPKRFTKAEKNFLEQIADAAALAVDRMSKLEQSESLKRQWESTFDAIARPLCLVDEEFHVLKANQAFAKAAGKDFKSLIGQNCFTPLLGFVPDLELRALPKSIQLTSKNLEKMSSFEIQIEPLSSEDGRRPLSLILFEDITEQLKLERQVLESSKVAEIGTIGSSIAHELNNPLAGMLSFLQLIKMDLAKADPRRTDVDQMEAAVLKCRDIVQSLLGFARRSSALEFQDLDLKEVILQSLKITELISRAKGIQIDVDLPAESLEIKGQFNLLVQALNNIIHNSIEAISQKMSENPRFVGRIQIQIEVEKSKLFLNIKDNGCGMPESVLRQAFNPLFTTKSSGANPGLGLTVALKIITDHGGRLELFSQKSEGSTARISLQRLDL